MDFTLRTLTPLWTGGVDQTCDRLHETGLIGSLRWWYEALVRGLGGYACDPTDEHSKCKEYNPQLGKKSVCAACYLFGTTGWARLFRLQVVEETIEHEPLHFYTTLDLNKWWLGSIFGGEKRNNRIDGITVPFGRLRLDFIGRGQDEGYALAQLAWTLEFASKYGGLGAKLQHGFGQIALATSLTQYITHAEQDLKNRLNEFKLVKNDPVYPTRQRFFSCSRNISVDNLLLKAILLTKPVGIKPEHAMYIPCVFDLRYRGDVIEGKQLGFRQWLINNDWKMDEICALLGETRARRDDERSASRIYFGMPWRSKEGYTLRVFGFVPPSLNAVRVQEELKAYLDDLFGAEGGR